MNFILVDTNVIIDTPTFMSLMSSSAVKASMVTRAELELGVHKAPNPQEQSLRKARLSILDQPQLDFWLPFDLNCSASYGLIAASVSQLAPGKARSQDALIAATAHAHGLPVYTSNIKDFRVFQDHIEVRKA